MTSPQFGLLPARPDDRRTVLGALELVASSRLQLVKIVGAEVRQCMPLEPGPQVFPRVQVGRIRRQERHLNMTVGAVETVAHQFRFVRLESIPNNQQGGTSNAP